MPERRMRLLWVRRGARRRAYRVTAQTGNSAGDHFWVRGAARALRGTIYKSWRLVTRVDAEVVFIPHLCEDDRCRGRLIWAAEVRVRTEVFEDGREECLRWIVSDGVACG